jgi:hypothetical protein
VIGEEFHFIEKVEVSQALDRKRRGTSRQPGAAQGIHLGSAGGGVLTDLSPVHSAPCLADPVGQGSSRRELSAGLPSPRKVSSRS